MNRFSLALAFLAALSACKRDAEPPRAAPDRPRLPRLARDTVLDRSRAAVYSAAMRVFADSGYRLLWFDARAGSAEFSREPGLWMRLAMPAGDSARTRVSVLAAFEPTYAPVASDDRQPRVPDDTATRRAASLVAAIAGRALSAAGPGEDLLRDSLRTAVGADSAEACRGATFGDAWIEIDHRRAADRCATPRLFGIAENVALLRRVDRLPLWTLLEVCREGARVPPRWSVAYSSHDDARCGGRRRPDAANVLVLRKLF